MDLNKEKELIEQAQEDTRYFAVLFDRYYPAIFNYTLKRTGNPELAQDITAETFFKALTSIHKFKWQGVSISSWFYKIATNEIRMYYRKKKYMPQSLDVLFEKGLEMADEHDFRQEIIAAQELVERHQEFMRVQALLANLPLKYQEVIALRFTEKKKISEIALITGKKEGTVKSLLSRGLAQLRKQMEQAQMQPSGQIGIVASEGRTILIKPLE
jgi:RNA polymerase sigma-70 factor (ECF subfamily)